MKGQVKYMKKIKNLKCIQSIILSIIMFMLAMTGILFHESTCVQAAEDNENGTKQITIHFKNACNWENVGIWIYEGCGFTKNVCPKDECPAYNTITNNPIWPGAKMTKEEDFDGWYSINVTFENTSNGAVMIFNNMVANTDVDVVNPNEQDLTDRKFLEASGLIMDTDLIEQTANQYISPKDFTETEYWCVFDGDLDGKSGKLESEKPETYVCKGETISLEECDISLSKTSYVYDGKMKEPTVKVRYGTKTLEFDKDYTISYKNNKNAGNAKVIIKASEDGEYSGKITKEFTISKAEPTLTVSDKNIELKVGDSTAKIKASTNSDGKLLYKSSKSSVATVDKNGKITAKKAGNCTITVMASESKNFVSKKTTIKLKVNQLKTQNIKCENKITKIYGDGKFSLNIKVKGGAKVTYTSSNAHVVTVSKDGVVNINNSGKAIIYVRVAGTSAYKPANKRIIINIKKASVKKVKVILRKGKIGFDTFDEEKDIKVMYGNKVLKYDKDYYFGGVRRSGIGGELVSLRVIVEGLGNYTGIKTVTLM